MAVTCIEDHHNSFILVHRIYIQRVRARDAILAWAQERQGENSKSTSSQFTVEEVRVSPGIRVFHKNTFSKKK